MDTNCRFPSCHWTGDVDNLFDHCETDHRGFIIDVNADNGFSFSFDQMMKETFLLNGENGLYWFLLDSNIHGIRRGIFAIGESEVINYTAKIGQINEGYVTYFGPYEIQPDTSDKYELELSNLHIELLNDVILNKCWQVYFGDYEDKDVYTGTYRDVNWADPEEEKYNELCLETFTCFICHGFIKSNARFCENRHFSCNKCLEKLFEHDFRKCSMCKADYPSENVDKEVEELLKLVRFPEEN